MNDDGPTGRMTVEAPAALLVGIAARVNGVDYPPARREYDFVVFERDDPYSRVIVRADVTVTVEVSD